MWTLAPCAMARPSPRGTMTSDIRSLPGGRITPSGCRKPPNDQRTTATTAPPGSASTLSIVEFGAAILEHHIEVDLMGLLHLSLSAPVHPHDIDPMNIIGRQPPHRVHIGGVPGGLPAVYDSSHFRVHVIADSGHCFGSCAGDGPGDAGRDYAEFAPRHIHCRRLPEVASSQLPSIATTRKLAYLLPMSASSACCLA